MIGNGADKCGAIANRFALSCNASFTRRYCKCKDKYELLCNLRDKQLYYIIFQKAKKNKLNLNVYINYIQHKFAIISILTSLD